MTEQRGVHFFDEIEILIQSDSLNIFPSLHKMKNFNSQQRRKMTLLKQFIKVE